MVTILIPTALRAFTDRKSEVQVEAANVGGAIAALSEVYPDIKQHLYQDGVLRSFINVFVGEDNIKNLDGLDTKLAPGTEIMLVPAIAGGREEKKMNHDGADGEKRERIGVFNFSFFLSSPLAPSWLKILKNFLGKVND